MHSWETMSQGVNFEQNWSTSIVNPVIKTEPQTELPFNNNSLIQKSESNPTSPHSIGSEESNNQNMYYNDTLQSLMNGSNIHRSLGFNPLTPPGLPNACLLRTMTDANHEPSETNTNTIPTTPTRRFSKTDNTFNSATLTPSHTPPMDQSHTPPKFRSDVSEKDCTDLDNSSMSGDDTKSVYSDYNQEISIPKVNSHGKVKTHKCKHCDYVGVTKKEFWEHSRQHIKPERQIQCKKCPFVTEYKHHFEYHLRNHEGSKPFKCPDCKYTCVNKSMLNSHLKSHSDIYQYRCENCSYATKYVHSLKLHLRKYQHEPAVPLDTDGLPDSTPIIDVYGTRRGPKKRSNKAAAKRAKQHAKLQKAAKESKLKSQLTPNQNSRPQQPTQPLQNILSLLPNMFPYPNMPNQFNIPGFEFNMQMLAARYAQLSPNNFRHGRDEADNFDCDDDEEMSAMNGNTTNNDVDISHPESPTSSVPNNISLQSLSISQINKMSDDEHFQNNSADQTTKINEDAGTEKLNDELLQQYSGNTLTKSYDCKHCGISYRDAVLHTIHMGCHGFNEVFTCNSCGEKCTDPISFNLHMIKKAHL